MIEGIVLGSIQGIAEWLPVSSEGMITLAKIHWFEETGLEEIIRLALFLHLGTFFSALIYLRKDVVRLLRSAMKFNEAGGMDKKIIKFLIISTLISGILGIILLKSISVFESTLEFGGRGITALIGALLLVTALLQLKKKTGEEGRNESELTIRDSVWLGLVQGLAVIPGLSRSGLTVLTLLLRKVRDESALKLSFLMSLPIVLGGNIVLNFGDVGGESIFSPLLIFGFIFSFLLGLGTIHALLKLARRINFGYFVGFFGVLMIVSSLL